MDPRDSPLIFVFFLVVLGVQKTPDLNAIPVNLGGSWCGKNVHGAPGQSVNFAGFGGTKKQGM